MQVYDCSFECTYPEKWLGGVSEPDDGGAREIPVGGQEWPPDVRRNGTAHLSHDFWHFEVVIPDARIIPIRGSLHDHLPEQEAVRAVVKRCLVRLPVKTRSIMPFSWQVLPFSPRAESMPSRKFS